jgi:hypothetical protein
MNPTPENNEPSASTNIPPGYTVLIGPDNHRYLVPSFMVETTRFALEVEQTRLALNVDAAATGVCMPPVLQCPDSLKYTYSHIHRHMSHGPALRKVTFNCPQIRYVAAALTYITCPQVSPAPYRSRGIDVTCRNPGRPIKMGTELQRCCTPAISRRGGKISATESC